jgi:superfamily II DNA/RNA helicase
VLQILSIIRGEKIAGLKDKNDANSAKNTKGRALNLQQKWEAQNQLQTKKCQASQELVFLMCSATLNRAVKGLALPLLSTKGTGGGFLVVDADAASVDTIRNEQDIMELGKDAGRLDGSSATAVAPSEGGAAAAPGDKRSSGLLDKGAVVEAPAQLAQYFMMVTCKWRLAALMSFLRTHADQKVVVFLSTCDAVDYVSLLLREMDWPTELDGGVDFQGGKGAGGKGAGEEGGSGKKRSIEEEEALATLSTLSANASQHLEPLDCTFTGMLGKSKNMYRLHGNVPQAVRKTVYQQFCNAQSGILLCTDVAARGLDLPNVDWILQYDPPCETADYVHRIGRTARKGRGCFCVVSAARYVCDCS